MADAELRYEDVAEHLKTNKTLGVPYSDDMIQNAKADLIAQANPNADGQDGVAARYPKAAIRDLDGDPNRITEMDALIAYIQMLGTTVDFSTYDASKPRNQR